MARKKCISWQKAEEIARRRLKREFKQEFTKKEIVIGNTARSFDLVSDNGKIIAQVKSCQKKRRNLTDAQIATRFKRGYVFDCLLLDRVNAQEKIFFLASDKELFDKFNYWCKGLVSKKIKLRFINAWK